MKRCLLKILLLVVIGAASNIVIAWTLHVVRPVLMPPTPQYALPLLDYSEQQINAMTLAEAQRALQAVSRARFSLARANGESLDDLHAKERRKTEFFLLMEQLRFLRGVMTRTDRLACGWPARSLSVTVVRNGRGIVEAHGGIQFTLADKRDALPIIALWPGFAIDTVFYAVVLWLLFAGPIVLRRWRRINRGLCPKCAYDLRGTPESASCPECGAANSPSPSR